MTALLKGVESILKWMVIIANGAMLMLVFAQVLTRYLAGWTPAWGEELARYMFVWVVFLSLPLVARHGGHMCIETITSRVGGMKLKTLKILGDLCSLAFLYIMVRYGIFMVERVSFQTSPAMMLRMSYVYLVIPFGCAMMGLYVLGNLIQTIRTPAAEFKAAVVK